MEKNCLDKDVLVTLLELAPKTQDFQVYKRYDVAFFGLKSGRAQYREGQKGGEDGKNKRGGEIGRDERGEKGHFGNEVNLIVEKSSNSEANVYNHIIYWCYQGLMVLGWGTSWLGGP